jgi:hypothetical protein
MNLGVSETLLLTPPALAALAAVLAGALSGRAERARAARRAVPLRVRDDRERRRSTRR